MSLIVSDLACRRGGRTVFAGLDFQVPRGRAAVVRGPNGVGKSTLLRVLAGFLNPSAGAMRLGPLDGADRMAWQEQVAYAGHLDAVKPALGVAENLGAWAGLFGAGQDRVAAALAAFGLDAIAERPGAECSAGQKRRLGLARLMVMDRPLWLLDEPTVSLDAASTRLVASLIQDHCASGGIALIATHIDLGIGDAEIIRMDPSAADASAQGPSDDAFLSGDWA